MLHSLPAVRQYLFSLYECRYAAFFQSLGKAVVFPTALFQVLQLFVSDHAQLLWSSYTLELEPLHAGKKRQILKFFLDSDLKFAAV